MAAELLESWSDPHCGCPLERWLVNGVDLEVHYERDEAGKLSGDAFLDWGCSDLDTSIPGVDVETIRPQVLAWAEQNTSGSCTCE